MLANKNPKYLPYQFKDWIELLNAEKIKIRHSLAVKDNVRLVQIEKKKKISQFLVEKIICETEKNNPTQKVQIKNQKLCSKLKKTIGSVDASINPCTLTLLLTLFNKFIF